MKKVHAEIQAIYSDHPGQETNNKDIEVPFVVGDIPNAWAKLGLDGSDFDKDAEIFDVSENP